MCAPEHDRTKTTARGKTLSAQIAYTRIPPGKSRAGIVIGGAAANATLPLNPGTFRAQHGQVSLRDPRATAATVGAELVPRIVEVADARALSTPPSIDSIGFELVTSPLPDACAPEVLGDTFVQQHDLAVAAYYSSLEETVKKLTRAHSATAFCHAVRSNKSATECRGAEAGYASYAHTDQSQDSWSSNAAALAQAGDMGVFPPGLSSQNVRRAIEGKRYAVLSAWYVPHPSLCVLIPIPSVVVENCFSSDGADSIVSPGASSITARQRILRSWITRLCVARTCSRFISSRMAAWEETTAWWTLQRPHAGTGGSTTQP